CVDTLQPLERIQLRNLRFLQSPVQLHDSHFVAETQRAAENPSDSESPEVLAVVQVRHQKLQHAFGIARRGRNMLHDDIKQRSKIVGRILQLVFRNARARVGIDDGKLQLILARIESDKQIVEFVENFLNAGVRPVNLVDDSDNRQLGLQRLHQNVPRL